MAQISFSKPLHRMGTRPEVIKLSEIIKNVKNTFTTY